MRYLLFGASGLLGQQITQQISSNKLDGSDRVDELAAPSSNQVDLRNHARVRDAILKANPDWIILSAAYTDVDGCESNRELAFAVNCDAAVNVAKIALEIGSRLLFVSTDYVFDGSKHSPYETTDVRSPASIYGESKAKAEERLLEILPNVCIARTSWLFGPGGRCFPATILKLAAARPEISVVNDQRGSPTYTADLASALLQLCRASAQGIVHVTNEGNCTWFDFAVELVRLSGLGTIVKPVTTSEFPRPARRPAYSVLSAASLLSFDIHLATWQNASYRYIAAWR